MPESGDPCRYAQPVTPGAPVNPGRKVAIGVQSEGWIRLTLERTGYFDAYLPIGTHVLDGLAVTGVDPANTTATARVTVLS